MGFEPGLFVRPPLRLDWIELLSSYRSVSLSRWFSRLVERVEVRFGSEEMGRAGCGSDCGVVDSIDSTVGAGRLAPDSE